MSHDHYLRDNGGHEIHHFMFFVDFAIRQYEQDFVKLFFRTSNIQYNCFGYPMNEAENLDFTVLDDLRLLFEIFF